jgi:hypothetical protein
MITVRALEIRDTVRSHSVGETNAIVRKSAKAAAMCVPLTFSNLNITLLVRVTFEFPVESSRARIRDEFVKADNRSKLTSLEQLPFRPIATSPLPPPPSRGLSNFARLRFLPNRL